MDGTLVDSTDGVVGAWELFKEKYPLLDVTQVLSSSHGVRTVENLRRFCGVEDPEEQEVSALTIATPLLTNPPVTHLPTMQREAKRFEEAIVTNSTRNGRRGILALPGVPEIMAELAPVSKGPKPRWAICTSATNTYATAALQKAGIPKPEAFVASEDVQKGKPEPDPYLLGAKKCGVDPQELPGRGGCPSWREERTGRRVQDPRAAHVAYAGTA
ncbi:hypothetical protein EVJ58_g410 [Rhodofomes roseus]|uniref:Phosphatase n=1 Tax=Rhodofomes roseus TaxID=34475 RepID=A0A4Y9Z5K4_9APHY|nr:hypothetical protein EVJ58_g410 [Rhodofomes roseus]